MNTSGSLVIINIIIFLNTFQHNPSPRKNNLQLTSSVKVLQSFLDPLAHGLLTLTHPHAGVEELLVGLVGTFGVTDGGQEVVLLVEDIVADTGQVGVLHVRVEVDLDDTVANGLLVLFLGGAGATVEDEEDGLVLLGAGLLLDVGLVTREQLGVQTDVTGLVDTVDVTETSGNGEVGADGGEGVVDGQDVFGLGVERVVVDILVVDAVFFATSDTDFLFRVSIDFKQRKEKREVPFQATASWERHA